MNVVVEPHAEGATFAVRAAAPVAPPELSQLGKPDEAEAARARLLAPNRAWQPARYAQT